MLFQRVVSGLSQSKLAVEKRAETKLPGRNTIVTIASVFIDDESRLVNFAILRLLSESFWATMWNNYVRS